jgi:nuclear autoantigenic sperm protein
LEPAVLGNALQGVPEEEEDSDAEENGEEADQETTTAAVENGAPPDATTTTTTTVTEAAEATTNGAATTAEPSAASAAPTIEIEDSEKLTEDERKEIAEEVMEALEENAECGPISEAEAEAAAEATEGSAEPSTEGTATTEEDKESADEEMAEGEAAPTDAPVATTVSAEEDGANGMQPDDDSNLELAWEMLDLARVIYEKQEGDEFKLKASGCYLKLGEVSLESDHPEDALKDLESCLNIRKALLKPNDRALAEVYYQMALAFVLLKTYGKAAVCFMDAKTVLLNRKEFLTAEIATATDEELKAKMTKELADMDALIPDLQGRIDDARESEKTADEAKSELAGVMSTTPAASESAGTPANDITGLIRKPLKRKSHEEAPTENTAEALVKSPQPKRVKEDENSATTTTTTTEENTKTADAVAPTTEAVNGTTTTTTEGTTV